jgi:small subunit ribosomal protein S17
MKILTGKIISNKVPKLVTLSIERSVRHPLYKKFVRKTSKIRAFDEFKSKVGDEVSIVETKPLSKTIFWKVIKKV